MENKDLWRRVFKTDPKAVKPITGKQYSGNSPKPYWIVERLTEEFGPCGIGWGFEIINERFERFNDSDTLHIAAVRFWYMLDDKKGVLEQIGQTKSSYISSKGSFILDEDAPKKSVTDALVKCASYLGFAGDIFSGRWDDSKYVAEAKEFYEEKARRESMTPEELAEQDRQEKRAAELEDLAYTMVEFHRNGKTLDAIALWYNQETFASKAEDKQQEQLHVWNLLKTESSLRSAIKANKPEQ